MKVVILHILCEGQTEERFVNDVLKVYLNGFGIICKSQLLLTNKQKNCFGGMLNYTQVKRDLTLLLQQYKNSESESHWFTTMFDLFRIPDDFPGFHRTFGSVYDKIHHLEQELSKEIADERFISYIQLHEYEALVFAGLGFLEMEYPTSSSLRKGMNYLCDILKKAGNNPELVNTTMAPSKHIVKALGNIHHYNKPKIGSVVAGKVGVAVLKSTCRHFGEWIDKLEKLKELPSTTPTRPHSKMTK